MASIFTQNIQVLKDQLSSIVDLLVDLTGDIAHDEMHQTISDLKQRVQDPYMFVIVGEVKSGKSSFVNALLKTGKEICKVAASPMTDTIQQIVYGEEEREVEINQYLKRIYVNEEKLKDIAVVDTPGTNTIVDHHQEITERFIPISDLIIFVFESKNPYRQSAWQFFDFINSEWRKKIVFVLQQKDLMEPEDLLTNIEGVKEYAIKKGILEPRVYAVSAKMEQNNQEVDSGFSDIRQFINENITGGQAPYLKLLNLSETCNTINTRIYEGLALRKKQYEADIIFRNQVTEILDEQELKTKKQVEFLVENLLAAYDRITQKKANEISQGISFGSMLKRQFNSIFGFDKSPKIWLSELTKDFEYELNTSLKEKLSEGVIDIADSIQLMGKLVDIKIKDSQTILKDNHEIFANIAERRANVLKDLQRAFSNFLKHSENFYDEEALKKGGNITPNLAAGGGIAIVGVIIATVTNAAVFDITGGILTTVGLLFAGVTVGLKRKKILKRFKEEIASGRLRLEDEVSQKLYDYTSRIKQRIDENFFAFDHHLETEEKAIEKFENSHENVDKNLTTLKADIEAILSQIAK